MTTKIVLAGFTASLAFSLIGCGEPTTLGEICKADLGSIKHFKGEVKVYKRVSYEYKYDLFSDKSEIEKSGKGFLIVDKDVKVDLEKFNAKEIGGYSIARDSINKGTPYFYAEQKYGDIGDKNTTEFLATLETLNPKCVGGEEIHLGKDTKITPIK
ncbi:hypothetical protein [uncultured Campylobacter sp.]|jgi:putative lipoprotein|uniref:hypothetical protein n=1 Tax=uncultured Campylobacter sp. TaxID=218934 RepID=UPI00261F090B|nr:hypothetical protein [uncultured Campylobacter sp.]